MSENVPVALKTVDRVEVLTLVDNYIDLLLPPSEIMSRPPLAKDNNILGDTLLAEHGLSLLVTVYRGDDRHTVLFDTGYTKLGVLHNMDMLGVDAKQIEAVVLSHGHMDHTGSLFGVLEKLSGPVPLVVHPGAFAHPRYTRSPDGALRLWPRTLVRKDLEQTNAEIVESRTPTLVADGTVLVTGEVERTSGFEKGFPNALIERDGEIVQDPIADDQSVVVRLRGKGLVVITGCAHSGVVNTLVFARKTTGEQNVHAVLGGFHLTGPFFEKIHEDTVAAIKEMNPEVVMPMHCTGWKAMQRFSKEFPSSFVLNSVGSKLMLAA